MLWRRWLLFWLLGECQAQRKEFSINLGWTACARSQDGPGCHQVFGVCGTKRCPVQSLVLVVIRLLVLYGGLWLTPSLPQRGDSPCTEPYIGNVGTCSCHGAELGAWRQQPLGKSSWSSDSWHSLGRLQAGQFRSCHLL